MDGYVAVTHFAWYRHLARQRFWSEVNFWRPSSRQGVRGATGTPFLFKLTAPHNAIGGFGLFARFERLPEWLAWDCFREANGAASKDELQDRLQAIRKKNRSAGQGPMPEIGCILLSDAVFFPREMWIPQPRDWSPNNLTSQIYDLTAGEGARVWRACQENLKVLRPRAEVAEPRPPYGAPRLVTSRLGQGTFRAAVINAYERACTITGEHSLPALDAAHIRPYAKGGPSEAGNGLLLRADCHRLFDEGYLTVTPGNEIEISSKLYEHYQNGRSYRHFHGKAIQAPADASFLPKPEYLRWHNDHVFR